MKKSLKLNILYHMAYEIFAICLPLITAPYVSRVLGAENLGIYSYAYSTATYFGLIAMLGVKTYGNREIARRGGDPEATRKVFWEIYSVQLIMSGIMLAAYLGFALVLVQEHRACFIAQTIHVVSCLLDISWLFFGLEEFKTTTIRSMAVKVFTTATVLLFVKRESDLLLYCVLMAAGNLLSSLILWARLPGHLRRPRVSLREAKPHLRPMLVLFIPVVAVSLYNIMDKIMLGGMASKTELGYYEATEKIVMCAKSAVTAFGTVMMPRMARLVAEGNEAERDRYMGLSMEVVMAMVFAIAFGIIAVARVFAPVFWGEAFASCAGLLVVLSLALPLEACANIIRTQYLIPCGMDKAFTVSVCGGAACNLIANALLIPRLGAVGAAAGTVIAEAAVFFIQLFYAGKQKGFSLYPKKVVPYALFGALMLVLVKLLDRRAQWSLTWLAAEILVGGAVYCLLALVHMIRTKNELLFSILNKFKKKSA